MNKIEGLIDKLQQLKNERAELDEMAHYTQLLYAELMCAKSVRERKNQHLTRKVAVIMPGYNPSSLTDQNEAMVEELTLTAEEEPRQTVATEAKYADAKTEKEVYAKDTHVSQGVKNGTLFDQLDKEVVNNDKKAENDRKKELNERIAESYQPSLNDKLKFESVELAKKLSSAPVKDLHKAIGLNEQFQFINELFRGDRNIYERSIKTINECATLEDAKYWITRELKIKQGWLDNNPTVQQFYSLVSKRFS